MGRGLGKLRREEGMSAEIKIYEGMKMYNVRRKCDFINKVKIETWALKICQRSSPEVFKTK